MPISLNAERVVSLGGADLSYGETAWDPGSLDSAKRGSVGNPEPCKPETQNPKP